MEINKEEFRLLIDGYDKNTADMIFFTLATHGKDFDDAETLKRKKEA